MASGHETVRSEHAHWYKLLRMVLLLFNHGSDQVDDLLEAKVHQLLSSAPKLIITDEDRVISIDEWDAIWQLLLDL